MPDANAFCWTTDHAVWGPKQNVKAVPAELNQCTDGCGARFSSLKITAATCFKVAN